MIMKGLCCSYFFRISNTALSTCTVEHALTRIRDVDFYFEGTKNYDRTHRPTDKSRSRRHKRHFSMYFFRITAFRRSAKCLFSVNRLDEDAGIQVGQSGVKYPGINLPVRVCTCILCRWKHGQLLCSRHVPAHLRFLSTIFKGECMEY